MAGALKGKTIAVFAAPEGTEQVELTVPWDRLSAAGARLELVSLEPGEIQMFRHFDKGDTRPVDKAVEEVSVDDYDGLVLPGVAADPDPADTSPEAVRFVRSFFDAGKPVAAICRAPWMLVEANVVRERTLTSWPSLQTDIRNAGGRWVDEEVVVDTGLVTSRKPADLDVFCERTVEEFAHQRRSA